MLKLAFGGSKAEMFVFNPGLPIVQSGTVSLNAQYLAISALV
jgi:hypothetical protein